MRSIVALLLLLPCMAVQSSWSQENTVPVRRITEALTVRMNAAGTSPVFVTFDPAKAPDTSNADTWKELFGSRPEDTWKLIRTETDQLGMVHSRYQQCYKGLEIDGNVYILHSRNGKLLTVNGHFEPGLALSVVPGMTPEAAITAAAAGMKQPVKLSALEHPSADLVIAQIAKSYVLVYKCRLFANSPLVNSCVYVDAHTGNVVNEYSLSCSTDAPGTAHTQYSGVRTIMTDSIAPNSYFLRESGRGGGVETQNASSFDGYQDADNDWNDADDLFATDIHFGAEMTYDFYLGNFNRNSYDNQGGLIRSKVNDYWSGANAFWYGFPNNEMRFGPGDNDHYPLGSLEIVGHEFTHGVTEYSAGLHYQDEAGALNESFSDIFGATVRFTYAPDSASWLVGDQAVHPGAAVPFALRNMAVPTQFMQPDTYGGQYFNSGDIVHYNSGIQNYWYYLLVEGGSGTNDLGNAFGVTSIGMDDAIQITYRSLVYYLTPTADFLDARYGAEQAAADLFGACSDEHYQVVHAWYAVGVGPDVTTVEAVAAFSNQNNFSCAAPFTSAFTGEGTYQSYSWSFGDGTTSGQQNPSHTYTTAGDFTVTLIVSNNNLVCQQPDTIVVSHAVIIAPIDPVAGFYTVSSLVIGEAVQYTDTSLYGAISWEWSFGDGAVSNVANPAHTYAVTGFYEVQLIVHNCHGTDTIVQQIEIVQPIVLCQSVTETTKSHGVIFDSGGAGGNYSDNETCSLIIRPCHASSVKMKVETMNTESIDYLFIYDGTENTGPMLAYLSLDDTITVTASSGAMYIEFQSDPGTNAPGFRLSYTSEFDNTPPGTALFESSSAHPDVNEIFVLSDLSTGNPVSWLWDLGDGNTSTLSAMSHQYFQPGYYTVTLTVTYCDGSSATYQVVLPVGTAGLEELNANENQLIVAPNPFGQQFHIQTAETLYELQARILDLSGRVVFTQAASEVQENGLLLSPDALSTGQYILEVSYSLQNGTRSFERHKLQHQ